MVILTVLTSSLNEPSDGDVSLQLDSGVSAHCIKDLMSSTESFSR